MEIRVLKESELQDAYYLSAQAFRDGRRDDQFAENRLKDENRPVFTTFGVFDEAGLQAKLVVIEYQQVFAGRFVAPMGGIGGVACLPASRGKGYAAAAIKRALEFMKESGQYLSALYPFAFEFYRRLGWEWVGIQRSYAVPTNVIRSAPETGDVRAATAADRPAIAAIYSRFSTRYRGLAARDEKMWNRRLNDGEQAYTYTYIYEADGGPLGYVTFQAGDRHKTRISEFISLTPAAQAALLGLLRRHEMQVKSFHWDAPEDDSLWSSLYHHEIKTRIDPVTQARIVDVAAALSALRPDSDLRGKVRLSVQDEFAPWNSRTYCIDVEGGSVEVGNAAGNPDLECDIQAVTQAYYGRPDLDAVRAAGRLVVHDEPAYSLLNELLSGPPMWLNDHF